jgi:hypothetical protein
MSAPQPSVYLESVKRFFGLLDKGLLGLDPDVSAAPRTRPSRRCPARWPCSRRVSSAWLAAAPPLSPDDAVAIARPPRWNFWGRGFSPGAGEHQVFAVYDAALIDQIMRAQQLRQRDRALDLSRKLESLVPSGLADALLLESYRLLGRKPEAVDWLTHLPMERRQHPAINVVLALWDRDDEKDAEARALLRSSAASYPAASPVQRALEAPLAAWPPDFASMTADPTLEVRMARQ